MKFHKIKSFAKINLTLKILNKYSNGYHKIESLISKINLADEILIKEIQGSKNRISFSGKFSSNISNTNTISKLLKIFSNFEGVYLVSYSFLATFRESQLPVLSQFLYTSCFVK